MPIVQGLESERMTKQTTLKMSERRRGSLAIYFIVHLPKTRDGYDAIKTLVVRITTRVHFLNISRKDTAFEMADAFSETYFDTMAFRTTLY